MQTPEQNRPQDEEALQAPPRLISALKELRKPSIFIPPTLDEAVLRAAHRHLNKRPKPQWFGFIPWIAAAAAAIVVLGVIGQFLQTSRSPQDSGPVLAQEDLNHDGQVDILDAFTLARQLKTGGKVPPQMDINHDGVVDERDVAAVAARAVSLEKGRRS
jgi:preprotein translocase subunit Sss1